jgi:hypothetical protein
MSNQGRVLVWQSQLARNDFPPVCAMSGEPAETWRKFTFTSAPPWAFWVGGLLLSYVLARRASGYLPLTRASEKLLKAPNWPVIAFAAIGGVLWVMAIVVGLVAGGNDTGSGVAVWAWLFGGWSFFVVLIAFLLTNRGYGPSGKVLEQQFGQYEPLVELERVHPKFVDAVRRHQDERARQFAVNPAAPILSESK